MGYRIGVDIGGSFTDFAVFDERDGSLRAVKVFSRPDKPGAEVMEGLSQLERRYGIAPQDVSYFTHGTTVGVNTVIQRKGLRLALFTTSGFGDVLELARLKTPDMYHLLSKRPKPLISRDCVFAIDERLGSAGEELKSVSPASVEAAVLGAKARGCEGVVVALLHSYTNPVHERAVRDMCAEIAPGFPVFLSSEVWPIIREYERTITATVSGYVQPRVAHYLGSLQAALKEIGVPAEPLIAKSNGGVMTAEQGKSECIQMILSGTASGVIGAAHVAKSAKVARAMSLDIGGTSADVALILDGEAQYGFGEIIGEFPIFIPSVSVTSIGDGGGSIAWIDDLGVLRVGPQSAGSTPGPACFGRGGTQPTVTDSFVATGLIGTTALGYDAVKVDIDAARKAVGSLAENLGKSVEVTAEAIQSLCVSGMYSGVNALVSRFGIDPREFTLVAFGGAGPMLAALLARELHMPEVLVPNTPGALSALGGLVADLRNDFIRILYADLTPDLMGSIREELDTLEGQARKWLFEEQKFEGSYELSYAADMRYAGQSYEIDTPLELDWLLRGNQAAVADAFHQRHQQLFGHHDRNAAIRIIAVRLTIRGATPTPTFVEVSPSETEPEPVAFLDAFMDGEWRKVPFFRRSSLASNHCFPGPAVIGQEDCTTVVPPGWAVRVDPLGNLRLNDLNEEGRQ